MRTQNTGPYYLLPDLLKNKNGTDLKSQNKAQY